MQLFDQNKQERNEAVTYCSFSTLLKQNTQARLLIRGSHKIKQNNSFNKLHATQSGKHMSAYKGQGMDFHESRIYQAGDDIRYLDWRVTARTGKPHTKVFTEEKERPVLLIVDMREPMFFGTRTCYKSVLAAKIASLLAWKTLLTGDKAGGVILTSSYSEMGSRSIFSADDIHKPSRSQAATSRFIDSLAKATQTINFSVNPPPLADSIKRISSLIEKGTQLIMLSDFRGLDDQTKCLLIALSQTSSLALLSISDPFEEHLSTYTRKILLTNVQNEKVDGVKGVSKIRLTHAMQDKFRRQQEARRHILTELSQQPNIDTTRFSTTDTASKILSKLLSMPMLTGGQQ